MRRPRVTEHRLTKFADRLFNERMPDENHQDRALRDLAEHSDSQVHLRRQLSQLEVPLGLSGLCVGQSRWRGMMRFQFIEWTLGLPWASSSS